MLNTAVGTPLYMSPQILKDEKYTSKSDVWSMGFIFYEAIFGASIRFNFYISSLDWKINPGVIEEYFYLTVEFF